MAVFTIDGIEFDKLRVLDLEQSFEILDGQNATRVLSGNMIRDIIGSYYNYKLKLKPQYSVAGMQQYNRLWDICSDPTESHTLVVPFDVGNGVVKTTLTFQAYITSGKRKLLKYDYDGVDYWGDGEFNFIAVAPAK